MNDADVAAATMGNSIVAIILELARYANAYHGLYGAPLARDGTLAVAWLHVARSCELMLNGDVGRLDTHHAHGLLLDVVERAGFPRDSL